MDNVRRNVYFLLPSDTVANTAEKQRSKQLNNETGGECCKVSDQSEGIVAGGYSLTESTAAKLPRI